MSRLASNLKHIVCIVVVGFLMAGLAVYVLDGPLVEQRVVPPPEIPLPDWMDEYRYASILTLICSGFFVFVWYGLAEMFFKVNAWKNADRRLWWVVIGIACVLVSGLLGTWYVPQAQAGGEIGYLLFFVSSGLFYYLATALFSPTAFKYTAWGAQKIRPSWL